MKSSTRRLAFVCVASALLCGMATRATASSILLNGSFEAPSIGSGYAGYATGSTGISGWTVIGPAGGNVALVDQAYTESGFTFPAQDGNQWLDLTGLASNTLNEGVQQTVSTTAGASYSLSFWMGNLLGAAGGLGNTSSLDVLLNGSSLSTFTFGGGGNSLAWQQVSLTFIATSSSSTVAFLNRDPSSDGNNALDDVSLELTPVPEPASILLFGSGLAALAVGRHYRRRAPIPAPTAR